MRRTKVEERIFFHIDVNSAFLSWTALKLLREGSEVDIREIPAIVGGDQASRHGIVVAKSIPAKKYGIETAEPVASALKKCPNLFMVPPEHAYYREQSRMLMQHLAGICPVIEQVSIDECYMDFEPIREKYVSPLAAAYAIRDSVYEKFGFTVNVGISNRKVLAKMASDFEKPHKVHTLYVSELPEKLWPMPIGNLHMCGKSSAQRLRSMGIETIGDLAKTDRALVESWLKSHGRLLWNYANGIDDSLVEPEPMETKGVGNSTTLSEDLTDPAKARKVLGELSESVSRRLRKKAKLALQVSVEIKYATFQSVSHQTTLDKPVCTAHEIEACAWELFQELWNGEPIRLLGVRTTKLEDEGEPVQMNLFEYQQIASEQAKHREKKKKLDDAMNSIRSKFGDGVIRKGAKDL